MRSYDLAPPPPIPSASCLSFSVSCVSLAELTDGTGGKRVGEMKIIRPRGPLQIIQYPMPSKSELNHVQGFPLLVCILTAVVDSYRPPYGSPTSLSYPHMGVYSCFLGRHTLQRQFRLYIPFLGIARPQPQFPHSCVCERFIYSQDRPTYFLQQKRQNHHGNI